MSTEQLAALLARTSNVLLDFDGPICSVFSSLTNADAVDELRTRLTTSADGMPETNDPFDILGYAARSGPEMAAAAHDELTRLEVAAVATASPTPGASDVLRHFRAVGRRVVVVSNNSTTAVQKYLDQHDLSRYVTGTAARTTPEPGLLKPNPHLIRSAINIAGGLPSECLMVGDSISDIDAAHAVGTPVVAYANKPGKRERFHPYNPDAIIDSMTELVAGQATV